MKGVTSIVYLLLLANCFDGVKMQSGDLPGTYCYTFCPSMPKDKTSVWQNHCYTYVSDSVNGKQAESGCVSLGGHLASINSESEQDFVFEFWQNSLVPHKPATLFNVHTTDEYLYQYLEPRFSNSVTFTFRVKAKNDVHIAMSSEKGDIQKMYEIVIGGWGNSQSVIRRSKQGRNEVTVSTGGIVNPTKFIQFRVTWDGQNIKVFKENDDEPFMEFADEEPIDVHYLGISTGLGSDGNWQLTNFGVSKVVFNVQTTFEYRYQYLEPRFSNSVTFAFRVKAKNDVHIAMSSEKRDMKNMYEIVIGGWEGSQSVIRRSKQGRNEVTVHNGPIFKLNPNKFMEFRVTWDGQNIQVFKENDDEPFMEFADEQPIEVHYLGISTGWGSDRNWQLTNFGISKDDAVIDANSTNSLWIGGLRSGKDWGWTDGSSWGYTKWEGTYSRNPDGLGDCVHMWTHNRVKPPGAWNDAWCEWSIFQWHYMCEKPGMTACFPFKIDLLKEVLFPDLTCELNED